MFRAANVFTLPECSDTKTPPSQPTHTCLFGAAGPVKRIEWMAACTLLLINPVRSAPAPVGGSRRREPPATAASATTAAGGAGVSKQNTEPLHCPSASLRGFTVEPP